MYENGNTIDIANDAIPCGTTYGDPDTQCPLGWACSTSELYEIGTCQAPAGNGTYQPCPTAPGESGNEWTEYNTDAEPGVVPPDGFGLPQTVACLTNLGIGGCGYEQQLQSAAIGLAKSQAQEVASWRFHRANALLVVMVVSDEEDCSIESKELFYSPEVQDSALWNISCGENQEYLYSTAGADNHFKTEFAKIAGDGVVFAAIVGVPTSAQGAPFCQGRADTIGDCLDHPSMQLNPVEVIGSGGNPMWLYEPACQLENVTIGYPGRRFVELAQSYGSNGYVTSICNANWTGAMTDIAEMIASRLSF